MPNPDLNVMEMLRRALFPVDPTKMEGQWQMRIPGGSGGTSTTDNSAFTPGSSSLTPMGGYYGGRTVSSGNIAVPALSGSAILQVDVVAGGAGGGVAQLQVQGTAANWNAVGFASGNAGAAGNWAVPVILGSGSYPTVNLGSGITATVNLGGIPTVNLGLGTINIGNGLTATVTISGIPTVNLGLGTVNIGNIHPITGSVFVTPAAVFTVWSANGAGGGAAQLQVIGTDNTTWRNVGFQSGNQAGLNVIPMVYASGQYATVNIGSGLTATVTLDRIPTVNLGLGTINVGNIPNIIGTVNPGSVFTVNLGLGTVNIGNGLTATVLLGNIPTVNLGLGTVNIGTVPIIKADVRGSLVATQWIIKATGGVATIAGAPAAGAIHIFSVIGVADATLDLKFQSPSGTDLTGTMRMLPGAGIVDTSVMGSELYRCPSGFYINFSQTANFGGIARGWVE